MSNVTELWVYKANKTTGTPVGYSDFSNCTTCVKFTWDNSSKTFVQKAGTNWLYTAQNACAGTRTTTASASTSTTGTRR